MPVRATKRGAERTPFPSGARYDVVICGASFAGLAVARELRASRARVLVLDRYEIGEKQTSACCAPTEWLVNLGLEDSIKQTFETMAMHTLGAHVRWLLPFTFSTFDYRACCELLWAQCGDAEFETAKVDGRTGDVVHTDRGDVRAPLIVDALGWRRVLGNGTIQPPEATLSRGLEVHPDGSAPELQLWVDPRYVVSGYAWSFPAGDELRIGVGSYDPRFHVKEPTVRLATDEGADTVRYQGNWIPHRYREPVEDGVFFCGDSAGHCIAMTAEGIRTAWYFGIAVGRELAQVLAGAQTREQALERYAAFADAHRWKFEWMWLNQRAIRHLHGRPLDWVARFTSRPRLMRLLFRRYLNLAPPSYALPAPPQSQPALSSLAA
ncbi:MAG TPA: NAD(P)/FAD-dependent oxidoreductase [Solirubrobacteraceae bacterium]|nr:NAD(P)/FAD-dependent oxidoreductase [Solirubrobacteraceae bacterium]